MYEDVRKPRAERFGRAAYCRPALIGSVPINIAPLQAAVLSYISALQSHYGVEFSQLPNVSQNGELRDLGAAKAQRLHLESLVFQLLSQFDVSYWARPSIRFHHGQKTWAEDHRFSTTKLHTDIWGGEHIGTMNILIPVFDFGVGCEFAEPKEMIPLAPQGDYNYVNDVETVPVQHYLRVGEMTFFDSMLLHRTVKNGSGFRIAIDTRGLYREQLPMDKSDWPSTSKYEIPNV